MDKELEEAMEGGCDGGRDCLGEECVCGEKHRQKLAAEVTRLRAAAVIIECEAEKIEKGDAPGLRAAARDLRDTARALTPSPENPPASECVCGHHENDHDTGPRGTKYCGGGLSDSCSCRGGFRPTPPAKEAM